MSEHRVTMLGASWRRLEDPARSRDPRVRALVGALAALPSPAPTDEFRAELRAQLIAIAPRIISESRESATPLLDIVPAAEPALRTRPAPARHTDSVFARIRSIRIGRPLVVLASVVTAFALLLGGAVVISRHALPGDTLYGLKRASENVELAFASGNTAKAQDYLEFAGTRVDEVQGLLARAHGNVDSHTASLISSTLASSNSDVRSASSLLGKQAVESKSADPLAVLTSWAPSQLSRLQHVAVAMPNSQLRNLTDSSAALVTAAVTRATQLAPKITTGCLSTTATDPLGPVPTPACLIVPSVVPPMPSTHPTLGPSGSAHAGGPSGNTGSTGVLPVGSVSPARSGTSGGSTPPPVIHLPLPSIPTTLPVNVKSCGIGFTLGPLGINLGSCSP